MRRIREPASDKNKIGSMYAREIKSVNSSVSFTEKRLPSKTSHKNPHHSAIMPMLKIMLAT